MKLSGSFVVSSLLCIASATSKVGRVFVYDPVPVPAAAAAAASPQHATSANPQTTRLILAQRLGLSRFHSIKHADDDEIQLLNAYGGRPQKLFGAEDRERTKAHVLVWVDDVEHVAGIIADESAYSSAFTIPNPPSSCSNQGLIQDLMLQAESLPNKPDPKQMTYQTGIEAEAILKSSKHVQIHNNYLALFRSSKADKLDNSLLSSSLAQLLAKSVAGADHGFPITVVLMPTTSSKSKREANPYGTYELPSVRQTGREPTEALLSSSAQTTTPNLISDLEDFPTILQSSNKPTPVRGILPACFKNLDLCQTTTKNCSGHGSCLKLHNSSKPLVTSDCYGCSCKPTIVEINDGGKDKMFKVTEWGGPACQKKDISIPFFLFAFIGILLAGLIAAIIGLMVSMGNEELPSVIGAGVSGPVRK